MNKYLKEEAVKAWWALNLIDTQQMIAYLVGHVMFYEIIEEAARNRDLQKYGIK